MNYFESRGDEQRAGPGGGRHDGAGSVAAGREPSCRGGDAASAVLLALVRQPCPQQAAWGNRVPAAFACSCQWAQP
jgi:hypothetical protein